MLAGFTEQRLQAVANWLWGLILLTLPVTTFRYIPGPLGRTVVKPLAFYPLALLLIIILVDILRKRKIALASNVSPL